MEYWKRAAPFFKLELERIHFKNRELAPIWGMWAGAGAAPKVIECVKPCK